MIAEKAHRVQVKVKFSFPNEPGAKITQLLVNPFSPLLNYKGEVESQTKMDLYGKKMQFKYTYNNDSYKIQYLQDIVVKTKTPLKTTIDIQIYLQQMGG